MRLQALVFVVFSAEAFILGSDIMGKKAVSCAVGLVTNRQLEYMHYYKDTHFNIDGGMRSSPRETLSILPKTPKICTGVGKTILE